MKKLSPETEAWLGEAEARDTLETQVAKLLGWVRYDYPTTRRDEDGWTPLLTEDIELCKQNIGTILQAACDDMHINWHKHANAWEIHGVLSNGETVFDGAGETEAIAYCRAALDLQNRQSGELPLLNEMAGIKAEYQALWENAVESKKADPSLYQENYAEVYLTGMEKLEVRMCDLIKKLNGLRRRIG